jgi:hypothetical protein
VNLASARLLGGDLDGAAEALELVWGIPTHQRVTGLLERTARLRHDLTAQPFRGAATAAALGERLEDFQRASAQGAVGPSDRPALEG